MKDLSGRAIRRRVVYLEKMAAEIEAARIRKQIEEAERLANALPLLKDHTGREMIAPTLTHGLAEKLRAKGLVK